MVFIIITKISDKEHTIKLLDQEIAYLNEQVEKKSDELAKSVDAQRTLSDEAVKTAQRLAELTESLAAKDEQCRTAQHSLIEKCGEV